MTRLAVPLDETCALLINRLSTQHKGKNNGIKSEYLASSFGITTRMLRDLITNARQDGVLIGGTPDHGYYIAQTAEEVEEYCDWLTSRALKSLTLVSKAKKIGLPELLGQMSLNT